MHTKKEHNIVLKATISNVIVAFIYVLLIVLLIAIPFSTKISSAISLINIVSVDTTSRNLEDVKINLEKNRLEHYPEYGSKYADIIIEDIDVNLPVHFGDTLAILKKGVGQSSKGYFPGEGGSIICMGHNNANCFRRLNEVKNGTKIEMRTTYGTYTYTVYDSKIVLETQTDQAPIQREEEILMIYTCYPMNAIGHTDKRLIVYAKLDA